MTHEFAHCMFEGGAIACPDGLGAFFSNGQDFDKGGGLQKIFGQCPNGQDTFEKGLPSVPLFAFVTIPLECLFSFMQKLSQEMPQWSMANDL